LYNQRPLYRGRTYNQKVEKFKNIEEAEAAFQEQSEKLEALKKENKQLEADNKELQDVIASVRASKTKGAELPTFTFEKETYEVLANARLNRTTYTAEQICKSKELQKQLVELGAGVIRKRRSK
jgi:predicted nuclease with TOPRIM domain